MGSTESTLNPAMEDQNENNSTTATTQEQHVRRPHRRRRRETETDATNVDPWWWEVENENLILDQVVTHSDESENAAPLSNDFNSLLKIGADVDLTLSDRPNSGDDDTNTAKTANASESENENSNTNCDYPITTINLSSSRELSANPKEKTDDPVTNSNESNETHKNTARATTPREQSLEEFKEELRVKRLARQTAVQDLRDEIASLRQQLTSEQALTRRLRRDDLAAPVVDTTLDGASETATDIDGACASNNGTNDVEVVDTDDDDPISRGRHANIELADAQLALQLANSENLSLRTELDVVKKQVGTLKEVIACCKQMLAVKEDQCTQLKTKLTEIEVSFGEREMKIMSDNLRQEYERQLGNIRQLRQLYEERQRVSAAEHENLQRLISIKRDELQAEQEKTKNFEERNQTLVKEVEIANNDLATLREECNEHKFEKKTLKEEMGAVNTLFSQMVMGFNGKNNLDIDRLTTMLEENRTLLNDMATKEANCSDGATLPKLLFELVEQAAVGEGGGGGCEVDAAPTACSSTALDDDDDDEVAQQQKQHATANDEVGNQATEEDEHEDDDEAQDAAFTTAPNSDEETTATAAAAANGYEKTVATSTGAEDMHDEVPADGSGATATCFLENDNVNLTKNTTRNAKKHYRKNANNKLKPASSDAATSASTMFKLHEPEVIGKVTSTQEIIGNLPKVWKVLMELLSHHKIEQVQFEENGASEDCYKSVETPNGPKAELSVSKTYIKLKDLILEKKSLVKETNRLKTLNSHLDYRLNEQEKRLSAVSLELTKTWHLVGKMQRQHRQLHTQEQILRYQLQQKRRLLSELKDELEYCRRKWAAARAKNDESQEQCNDLRREFAKRKLEDANNSAESGYSDSGPGSDEEERAAAAAEAALAAAASASVASGHCRRKNLKEMFEHTRKIKRMQSTSPERAACGASDAEIVLRWNSAPPTCGWRGEADDDDDDDDDDEDNENAVDNDGVCQTAGDELVNRGAIPKYRTHTSRRIANELKLEKDAAVNAPGAADPEQRAERATRIQRLEEQCKSLIQQVLETSDNREKLEVQLCHFQDEIAPVQYAVPLDEFINKKRIERMTRASSAPATSSGGSGSGSLTPREEEYTRKRSERLGRLEEESRQLMSRIKRTSDRGHYLRCSLDRIRRVPSREGSFESNTEEETSKTEDTVETTATEEAVQQANIEVPQEASDVDMSPLTMEEVAYTTRRALRLQRLEEEGKQLLSQLSRNSQRSGALGDRLDTLHERYGNEGVAATSTDANSVLSAGKSQPTPVEQRIDNIEKIATNRQERLRILEEEGKQLLTRLSNTSERGTQMINRINERELNRQAASSTTPSNSNFTDATAQPIDGASTSVASATVESSPVALMPTPKNVACSSIVDEELSERVTVTSTPSQMALQRGATPKSKPFAELSASRQKTSRKPPVEEIKSVDTTTESLEDMVKRLRETPFPENDTKVEEVQEPMPQQEVPDKPEEPEQSEQSESLD